MMMPGAHMRVEIAGRDHPRRHSFRAIDAHLPTRERGRVESYVNGRGAGDI